MQAVVGLARAFSVQTVAEGVEDAETLDLLSRFGVDFAQGFHIARPAPFVGATRRPQRTRGAPTADRKASSPPPSCSTAADLRRATSPVAAGRLLEREPLLPRYFLRWGSIAGCPVGTGLELPRG